MVRVLLRIIGRLLEDGEGFLFCFRFRGGILGEGVGEWEGGLDWEDLLKVCLNGFLWVLFVEGEGVGVRLF